MRGDLGGMSRKKHWNHCRIMSCLCSLPNRRSRERAKLRVLSLIAVVTGSSDRVLYVADDLDAARSLLREGSLSSLRINARAVRRIRRGNSSGLLHVDDLELSEVGGVFER